MTIATESASITLQGDGATKVFGYNFIIPYQADGVTPAVTVTLGTNNVWVELLPSEYSIAGVGNAEGGTVTYPLGSGAAIGSTTFIRITRAIAYTQPDTFDNQSFYPKEVEVLGDQLEMQIQQLLNAIDLLGIGNYPVQNGREFYTSNFLTPMDADAAAFAARGGLVVDSIYTFSADEEFHSSVVRFTASGLWIRSTHILKFDGVVFAPETQIFDTSATAIQFSLAQGTFFASWFGVKADDYFHQYGNPVNPNATDDTIAWRGCFASAAVASGAPEILCPRGVSKITGALQLLAPYTTINGSNYSLTGIKLTGRGQSSSIFQSYLSTGTMLTIGITAVEPSGGNQGYSMQHVGFSSAGTETLLVDVNFCRLFTMDHCGFHGGYNRQFDLGRAQDYFIKQNLFEGYGEKDLSRNLSVYGTTSACITITTDAQGAGAGPSFISENLIAHIHNATHTAVAVNILAGGGHRIFGNEIGDADVSVANNVNGNSVTNNRFESSGAFLTAVAGGGNVGNGTVSYPLATGGPATYVGSSAICEAPGYIFTFTGPTTATVVDPTGTARGNMTVGTNYVIDGLTILFTAGTTPWTTSDVETITATSDIILKIRAGSSTYDLNRFSSDSLNNARIVDCDNYSASTINDNVFFNSRGVVVYFSANNANHEEVQFQRNSGLNCRTQISDLGTSGKIFCKDNLEPIATPGFDTLTPNSTTPNVRNLASAASGNTSATSITDFPGGYNGMELTYIIRDANTTLVQGGGSTLILLNGSTKTYSVGDVLFFKAWTAAAALAAPVWQQIAGTV